MPTYLIEREIPGADKLTDEELAGITQSPTTSSRGSSVRTRGVTATSPATRSIASTRPRAPRTSSSTPAAAGSRRTWSAEVAAVFGSTGTREMPAERRIDSPP